jgi:hypothetical protein
LNDNDPELDMDDMTNIIIHAFGKQQKIYTMKWIHKYAYVYNVEDDEWMDYHLKRNSDDWDFFHKHAVKIGNAIKERTFWKDGNCWIESKNVPPRFLFTIYDNNNKYDLFNLVNKKRTPRNKNYFIITFCYDFLKNEIPLLVAIYHDWKISIKEKDILRKEGSKRKKMRQNV